MTIVFYEFHVISTKKKKNSEYFPQTDRFLIILH